MDCPFNRVQTTNRQDFRLTGPGSVKSQAGLRTRRATGTAILEFGPVLYLFFFLILFPLLNLGATGAGSTTVYMIAKQTASRASTAASFGQALADATLEAKTITQSGLGRFLNLQPVGGASNSGIDLAIKATNIYTSQTTTYPANQVLPVSANPSTFVYEYASTATFNVGPLLNMAGVPLVATVPGLGKPATISLTSYSVCEYPEGLGVAIASSPNNSIAANGFNGGFGGGVGGGIGGVASGMPTNSVGPKSGGLPNSGGQPPAPANGNPTSGPYSGSGQSTAGQSAATTAGSPNSFGTVGAPSSGTRF